MASVPDVISAVAPYVSLVASLISLFGVLVIAYGAAIAVRQILFRAERPPRFTYARIRGEFAQKIIVGLDFLIASDILNTISAPSLEEVARLGGIVAIRAILTFVLSKETNEMREERRAGRMPGE